MEKHGIGIIASGCGNIVNDVSDMIDDLSDIIDDVPDIIFVVRGHDRSPPRYGRSGPKGGSPGLAT